MEKLRPYLDKPRVLEGLKEDFGLELHTLESVSHEHGENEVYFGQTEAGEVVVRISRLPAFSRFPIEVWAYKQFAEKGIPSPQVIAYQKNPPHLESPTIILNKIPGKPLKELASDTKQESMLYCEAGQILRDIHTIKIDGFGYLNFGKDVVKGSNASWKEHWQIRETPKQFHRLVEENIITHRECDVLTQTFDEVTNTDVTESVFLHNDYHSQNLLADGNSITGVIDLCNGFAGDPRYDIATALFFQNTRQRDAFIEGYGALAKDPLVEKYLLLVSGLKISSRFQRGIPRGVEKALKVFRELSKK